MLSKWKANTWGEAATQEYDQDAEMIRMFKELRIRIPKKENEVKKTEQNDILVYEESRSSALCSGPFSFLLIPARHYVQSQFLPHLLRAVVRLLPRDMSTADGRARSKLSRVRA